MRSNGPAHQLRSDHAGFGFLLDGAQRRQVQGLLGRNLGEATRTLGKKGISTLPHGVHNIVKECMAKPAVHKALMHEIETTNDSNKI